jgi:hypothetical protein
VPSGFFPLHFPFFFFWQGLHFFFFASLSCRTTWPSERPSAAPNRPLMASLRSAVAADSDLISESNVRLSMVCTLLCRTASFAFYYRSAAARAHP